MSMADLTPFQISGGASSTTSVAVTASSAQLTIPTIGNEGAAGVITVLGTQTVFIAYGNVTASVSTSMPLLANSANTLAIPPGVTQISVIAAATGSTIYVTTGKGT